MQISLNKDQWQGFQDLRKKLASERAFIVQEYVDGVDACKSLDDYIHLIDDVIPPKPPML